MGLLFNILTFPYAPVRGVTAVVKVLYRQAETALYSPEAVRRQLEDLDAAAAEGRLTDAERAEAERAILGRLMR
jgi:hypothetical protein